MNSLVKPLINQLTEKPKALFLIDSLGALLTAFLLFVIWRYFNEYIGMPARILIYLALTATCFCIYSTACFFFLKRRWASFIMGISIANLLYCIFTMGLLIINYALITKIGMVYFLLEIAVVLGLVYIELNVVAVIKKTTRK